MRELLRTGAGAILVVLIMFIGSLGLWVGTPLLWLWVGSQIQGATSSLGTALGAAFLGVVLTIMAGPGPPGKPQRASPAPLPGRGWLSVFFFSRNQARAAPEPSSGGGRAGCAGGGLRGPVPGVGRGRAPEG